MKNADEKNESWRKDKTTFSLSRLGWRGPHRRTEAIWPKIENALLMIFEMVQRISVSVCRKRDCLDLTDEVGQNTLLILKKAKFRGKSSLKTYIYRVADFEALRLIGIKTKNEGSEIDNSFVDPRTLLIAEEVLRRMTEEQNMALLLTSGSELRRQIIETVIGFENAKKGADAIPSREQIIKKLTRIGYRRHEIIVEWRRLKKHLGDIHKLRSV